MSLAPASLLRCSSRFVLRPSAQPSSSRLLPPAAPLASTSARAGPSSRPFSSSPARRLVIPQVVETTSKGERSMDLFSRLLKERVMFVGDIDGPSASLITNQLLFLEAQDAEKPIQMYINSYGGPITDVLSIFDTMAYVSPPIHTVCLGQASSTASLLLAAGSKGHRSILPNALVMLSQPYGGHQGQQTDIGIAAKEVLRQRELLEGLYWEHCKREGETLEDGKKRFRMAMDRDFYLTPQAALDFGLVDTIQLPRETEAAGAAAEAAGGAEGEGGKP